MQNVPPTIKRLIIQHYINTNTRMIMKTKSMGSCIYGNTTISQKQSLSTKKCNDSVYFFLSSRITFGYCYLVLNFFIKVLTFSYTYCIRFYMPRLDIKFSNCLKLSTDFFLATLSMSVKFWWTNCLSGMCPDVDLTYKDRGVNILIDDLILNMCNISILRNYTTFFPLKFQVFLL